MSSKIDLGKWFIIFPIRWIPKPRRTIDLSLSSGEEIPIEERNPEEITSIGGIHLAPKGVKAANPAFDITPHQYISAIITEKGVVREPHLSRLKKLRSWKST
jgi:methylthioribose-1-phosphate isomerase